MGEARPLIEMRGIYKRFYIGQPNELETVSYTHLRAHET